MSLKSFDLRPLYLQVVDDFIGRIVSGDWPAGQFITSETEIARELGLSIGTVRRAFDILDQYGVLDRSQGKGTLILDAAGEEASRRFITFVNAAGERVAGTLELLDARVETADQSVARDLRLDKGGEVLQLDRRRTYLDRVFLVEQAQCPFVPAAGNRTRDALMQAGGDRWYPHSLATRMLETVRAVAADAGDVETFGVDETTPILELTRIVFSYDNKPLERRVARCYLGDDLTYESA